MYRDKATHLKYAEWALELMEQDNFMKERVEVERLDRNTKACTKIDAKDWCPEFPK
jgi:hypothetical protein